MAERETEIPGVVPLKTCESPSLSLTSESLLRDLLATSLAQTNPTTAKPIDPTNITKQIHQMEAESDEMENNFSKIKVKHLTFKRFISWVVFLVLLALVVVMIYLLATAKPIDPTTAEPTDSNHALPVKLHTVVHLCKHPIHATH